VQSRFLKVYKLNYKHFHSAAYEVLISQACRGRVCNVELAHGDSTVAGQLVGLIKHEIENVAILFLNVTDRKYVSKRKHMSQSAAVYLYQVCGIEVQVVDAV